MAYNFENWKIESNKIFVRDYGIDFVDAGLGDDDMMRYFGIWDNPKDFVEWFAEKMDLAETRCSILG